jgi:hypothetical protein
VYLCFLEEVRSWGKLHNEELHNWYAPQNNIRVIESMRMGRQGEMKCKQNFKENLKARDHLGKVSLEGGTIWRCVLEGGGG